MKVSKREIATFFHVDAEIVFFIPELLADFDAALPENPPWESR